MGTTMRCVQLARRAIALMAVIALAGCDADGEGAPAELQRNGLSINGLSINGLSINGLSINGLSINGLSINGLSINGLSINGVAGDGVELVAADSVSIEGYGNGFVLTARYGDDELALRVSEREFDVSSLHMYQRVEYLRDGEWEDVCHDGEGATKAIALSGTWSIDSGDWSDEPGVSTLACQGSALEKAAAWGYSPRRVIKGEKLAPYHRAGTRMIRADYCYSGAPNTVDGTVIDVGDPLGINEHETDWAIEAVWGEHGLLCLNEPRVAARADIPCELPRCDEESDDHWLEHTDALVITRAQP